jgi:hypothetical protein
MLGRGRGQGIALMGGLIFLAITVVSVSIALLVSTSNRRLSADHARTIEAQLAADAGLERAIYETWFKPNLTGGDLPENFQLDLALFRQGLDDAGIIPGQAVSATQFSFGPAVTYSDSFENVSYSTSLRRVDVGDVYTLLRLESLGTLGEAATRRITEDFRIGLPELESTQFALLSNQANCVFCHTQVTSLEVGYDPNGNLLSLDNLTEQQRATVFKNKARIRVGVLEKLLTDRNSEMKSLIAGTLYSRGETNLFSSNSSLYSVPFYNIDGHKTGRLSGEEPKILQSAMNCDSGCDQRLEQAYRNYPTQGPDGELPGQFPSLIEDENHNRNIEHSEWQEALSSDEALGKLKGGSKKRVNTTTSGTATLTSNRSTGLQNATTLSSLESANGVAANVVLQGTPSSPLVIEDTLYINGDVVIGGSITGDGKIVARGNIYIAGDITYACDKDSKDFIWSSANQKPCNYALPDTLPRLGLVAGKNILLGNYMMPKMSSSSRPEDQLTRQNFSNTSPEDLAKWFVDAGQPLSSDAMSYSMIQIALLNQEEYDKARDDEDYIPRFYRMREDSPVWLCDQGFSDDKNDYCKTYNDLDNLSVSTSSDDEEILARASLLSLSPTDSWLSLASDLTPNQSSELAVRSYWVDSLETKSTQKALHIDGVLFSNNAMFGLLPSASATAGKAMLNGSLMVADNAFLPSKGLRIHYDERLSELIDPSIIKTVVQTRSNYRLLKVGEAVNYSHVGYE